MKIERSYEALYSIISDLTAKSYARTVLAQLKTLDDAEYQAEESYWFQRNEDEWEETHGRPYDLFDGFDFPLEVEEAIF